MFRSRLLGVQIQAELRAPLVVTFAPADPRRDGSFRKLKIEVANPELRQRGAKVSHPYGYFHGDAPGK